MLSQRIFKKTPFCQECKFYGGKTVCNHSAAEGKHFDHIKPGFWCCCGEVKEVPNAK